MAESSTPSGGRRLIELLGPIALLLIAMISMQGGAAYAKGLFGKVGPQGATALRLGFSALILAVVRRPWRDFRLSRSTWPLIAYGVCLGAMNTLFYMALRTVPLGVAIALEFIGPLMAASLGSRKWLDFAWIGLAVIGVLLLLPIAHSAQPVDPRGAALALASGACWALYIVFGRKVGAAYGSSGAALGMIIAATLFAPIGVASAGTNVFDLAIVPSGILLALLSSAVPYSLEMTALTRIPVRAFGILMSLEPAVGAMAGLLILGEMPTALQWAGIMAVIMASVGTAMTV